MYQGSLALISLMIPEPSLLNHRGIVDFELVSVCDTADEVMMVSALVGSSGTLSAIEEGAWSICSTILVR